MNQERLEKLKDRAKQAVELAAVIERLNLANPYASCADVRFYKNGVPFLDSDLLNRVFEAGRLCLIEQSEKRLEGLLSAEPEPVTEQNTIAEPEPVTEQNTIAERSLASNV